MSERRFLAEDISPTDLAGALQDERLVWVYAEQMADTVLVWAADFHDIDVPMDRWQHGRAFGEKMEVAWWREGKIFQVRTIIAAGETQGVMGTPDPDEQDYSNPEKQSLLLVGEQDKDMPSDQPSWSTARIPRYLYYPVEGRPQRVALVVARYRVGGVYRDQRFVKLTKGGKVDE